MGQAPIRAAGHVLRHAVGVLLLCWVRALRVGLIAGVAGVLLVEIGAMVMTQRFPPDGTAQLVAALLGCALAFGAAATVVVDEILEGMRELVGMLLGEAKAGARVAATLMEREVGESSAGVLRMVGLGRLLDARPAPGATAGAPPATLRPAPAGVGAASRWEPAHTSDTLAELAGEPLAPVWQRADASPVPADQLPRLTWTDELPIVRPAAPTLPSAPAPAQRTTPPADLAPVQDAPEPWQAGQEGGSTATDGPDASEAPASERISASEPPAAAPDRPQPATALAEPASWHADETPPDSTFTWHDPVVAAEPQDDEESFIQPIDVFGAPPPLTPARDTEPLTRPVPETSRPFPVEPPDTSPRGSVWDHISQVLAGRPVVPLPEDPASADDADGEAPPPAH